MLSVQFLVVDSACSSSWFNFLKWRKQRCYFWSSHCCSVKKSLKMAAWALARPSLLRHLQSSFPVRAFVPSPLATIASWSTLLPKLESLLELFPPWLLAAPKKKTSHSRKRMRSANKGLQDKESESKKCERLCTKGLTRLAPVDITACPACGRPRLMHNLCAYCFGDIRRGWKGKLPPINVPDNNAVPS